MCFGIRMLWYPRNTVVRVGEYDTMCCSLYAKSSVRRCGSDFRARVYNLSALFCCNGRYELGPNQRWRRPEPKARMSLLLPPFSCFFWHSLFSVSLFLLHPAGEGQIFHLLMRGPRAPQSFKEGGWVPSIFCSNMCTLVHA